RELPRAPLLPRARSGGPGRGGPGGAGAAPAGRPASGAPRGRSPLRPARAVTLARARQSGPLRQQVPPGHGGGGEPRRGPRSGAGRLRPGGARGGPLRPAPVRGDGLRAGGALLPAPGLGRPGGGVRRAGGGVLPALGGARQGGGGTAPVRGGAAAAPGSGRSADRALRSDGAATAPAPGPQRATPREEQREHLLQDLLEGPGAQWGCLVLPSGRGWVVAAAFGEPARETVAAKRS